MTAIPLFLLWIIYFLITLNARDRYSVGLRKGLHCVASKDDLTGTDYFFRRGVKPYREYKTWVEWWTDRGYYKNLNQ